MKATFVNIRVSPEFRERIKALADEKGITVSQMGRLLLERKVGSPDASDEALVAQTEADEFIGDLDEVLSSIVALKKRRKELEEMDTSFWGDSQIEEACEAIDDRMEELLKHAKELTKPEKRGFFG